MSETLWSLLWIVIGAVLGQLVYYRWLGPRWFPELYPKRGKR